MEVEKNLSSPGTKEQHPVNMELAVYSMTPAYN